MRLYKTYISRENGFTLIELMITAAFVVLVLVGFMGANTALHQASESAFERTLALQDANQVLERVRQTAVGAANFPGDVVTAFPQNGAVAGFTNLAGEAITVSYVNVGANPLDVTVRVAWQERGRRNVTAQIRSLVTQRT